ncbi:MAG: TonB family protein [Opitutaceae bacterium]
MALSALLHAAVAGVLVWWMWGVRHEPEPRPVVVFEIPTFGTPTTTQHTTSASATTVGFTPIHVDPPVRVRDPGVESEPRPQVVARSIPVTPRSTSPRVPATPARVHPVAGAHEPVRPVAPSPRINMDEVLAATGPVSGPTVVADGGVPETSADYFARLLGRLRAAHEKPAGLDEGLQTRVEFLLKADGTLGAVRILQSSGSDAFDASVLAAFRRLRDLGVPPAGAAGVNQVTFRTQAE